MASQRFVWLFVKEELFDRLVLQDILEYVADFMIYLLATDFYKLEACLNKLTMSLKENALAPFIISNSICYCPNNGFEKLDSAEFSRIVALFSLIQVLIDRAKCGEHRRAKYD